MGATNAEAREHVSRRQAVRGRRLTAGSITGSVRRFWRLAWDANLTGMSAMLAYNMLLGIIPVALLGLFIAGQVLSSTAVQQSVLNDLRQMFPGTAEHTLNSLLSQIRNSTHQHWRAGADRGAVAGHVVLGSARHRVHPDLRLPAAQVARAEALRPGDARSWCSCS